MIVGQTLASVTFEHSPLATGSLLADNYLAWAVLHEFEEEVASEKRTRTLRAGRRWRNGEASIWQRSNRPRLVNVATRVWQRVFVPVVLVDGRASSLRAEHRSRWPRKRCARVAPPTRTPCADMPLVRTFRR